MKSKKFYLCATLKYLFILISLIFWPFIVYSLSHPSIRRYPIWWWFWPHERLLCDRAPSVGDWYSIPTAKIDNHPTSPLNCRYLQRNYLYRYKIETIHADPDLVLIVDFAKDAELRDLLIEQTKEYSETSPVYTLVTDTEFERKLMESLDFRTSNSIEFGEQTIPTLFSMAQQSTGLDVSNLDGEMNVLWYRPGGHIIPHHDVYPYSDSISSGRRFATLIIYFQSPESGGATIFPKLGLSVVPRAGDAIFWYNVLTDNAPDPLLSHAGCPVWRGEKVIGTFWFRHFRQEFRRPCPSKHSDRFSFY